MNESEYCTYLRSSFLKRHPEAFWHKMPDTDMSQKPFDGFWICDGRTVCWEAKIHKSMSPWSFEKIEPHQIANLRRVAANLTGAFVVLGIRARLSKSDRQKMGTDRINCWMDIWIPVSAIPGDGKCVDYKSLDVRKVWSTESGKGSRVREIYLPKERLAQVAS